MERIALTNGSGHWFDKEKAEEFDEETRWNGNNHISKATGSQWEHEALFRTASGKWILHCWSNMSGSLETYQQIDDDRAAAWLTTNDNESDIVKDQIADLEL